jgi:tRNA A22 N-methylase
VEVGCDHGLLASKLDAIGTERQRHRLPARSDLRLVVADGLLPFRRVGVAVVTGIGAAAIARILSRGPRPEVVVLHAPDRPAALRVWLADNGWHIDAEVLAPEDHSFAEIIRAVPGRELHEGLRLAFGPLLDADPLIHAHEAKSLARWMEIMERVKDHDPVKAEEALAWIAFLKTRMERR